MVLQNRACSSNNNLNCDYNRTFIPQPVEINILSVTNATLVAYFDILENVKY